jgi:Skp family chaperone for outer membrane proteins
MRPGGLLRGAILAAALCAGLPAAAQTKRVPGVRASMRIAVVDLKKVIDSYKKSKEIDGKMQQLKATLRQSLVDKEKKIAKMAQALKFLKRPSAEWGALTDNIQREKAELAALRSQAEVMGRELFRSYVVQVFEDVQRHIQATAKRDGFDLVLKQEEPGIAGGTDRELSLKLNMKSVLYASERLDITERIIRSLNAEYDRTRRAATGGGKR